MGCRGSKAGDFLSVDGRKRLLRWYRRSRRPLPWRQSGDPYRVWVSEVMLQQTQVDTVIPYFLRFMERFPSLPSLASAATGDVLKAWEGLGYYSRARNLRHAARTVMDRHAGAVPKTLDELRDLPGVGPYTAAAIASICFGVREPVVDGNVMRVFARFLALKADPRRPAVRSAIADGLRAAMARVSPSDFNQAIMELGALVCRPRSPDCGRCPLRHACAAHAAGEEERYPVGPKARRAPTRRVAVAWTVSDGRTLAVRRSEREMLGGLWKFPSVRLNGRRDDAHAELRRAVLEQTGCRVRVGRALGAVSHTYSHFVLEAEVYLCRADDGCAARRTAADVRWITPADMRRLPFSNVERKIAALCLARLV